MLIADAYALRRAGIVCLLRDWASMHSVDLCSVDLPDMSGDQDVPLKCCLCVVSVGSLSLIDETASDWLTRLTDRFPATPWVVLSDRTEPVETLHALKQGACGFIPTSMSPDLVRHALSFILGGGTFFPPEALMAHPVGKLKRAALPGKRRSDGGSEPAGFHTNKIAQFHDGIGEDGCFKEMWSAMASSVIWPDFGVRAVSSRVSTAGVENDSETATIIAFPPSYRSSLGSKRRPK